MEIIELFDENNEVERFCLIDTFGVDSDDYTVLSPIDSSDETIYIFKTKKDNDGNLNFIGIDSQKELDEIVEFYESLKNDNEQ